MSEMKWRRTPLPNAVPDDWYVCDRYGAQIARVMKVEHGPQVGSWRWSARTQHLPNQGTEPTIEAARATAKRRWQEDPLDLGKWTCSRMCGGSLRNALSSGRS